MKLAVYSLLPAGPNPSIHSHSHFPLVALYTGCFSAIQKISEQLSIGVGNATGFLGSRPGIHSHSQSPVVALIAGCISEIQIISIHRSIDVGSSPGIHSQEHELDAWSYVKLCPAMQNRSGQSGSQPHFPVSGWYTTWFPSTHLRSGQVEGIGLSISQVQFSCGSITMWAPPAQNIVLGQTAGFGLHEQVEVSASHTGCDSTKQVVAVRQVVSVWSGTQEQVSVVLSHTGWFPEIQSVVLQQIVSPSSCLQEQTSVSGFRKRWVPGGQKILGHLKGTSVLAWAMNNKYGSDEENQVRTMCGPWSCQHATQPYDKET